MSATISEETRRKDPRGTREPDLDAMFRELDNEPEGNFAEGQPSLPGTARAVPSKRAGGSYRSKGGRVAKRAGPVLMAIGMALIAGAFLTLGVSLSLFLFLNVTSLLLIALGVLLLPDGSARH